MDEINKKEIIKDIAERALGGFENSLDDEYTYPRMILDLYKSEDCPPPLDQPLYQNIMESHDEDVYRAIWLRVHGRDITWL